MQCIYKRENKRYNNSKMSLNRLRHQLVRASDTTKCVEVIQKRATHYTSHCQHGSRPKVQSEIKVNITETLNTKRKR